MISVGTTVTRPCPRKRGVTIDPIASRNTSVLPATAAVATRGIVIRQNATMGCAPRERAASRCAGSRRSIDASIGNTMKGTPTCTSTTPMPPSEPSSDWCMPRCPSSSLSSPRSPSTITQPRLRTTMLTISGSTTADTSNVRGQPRLFEMMNASGTPISREHNVTVSASRALRM
jgi:hypothetical protein